MSSYTTKAKAKAKAKVYIIVHDGTNVMVGTGGKSGKHRQVRQGYHLPGGTQNPNETPFAAARRELEEETGVIIPTTTAHIPVTTSAVSDVTFIVVKVASVANLCSNFKRPAITDLNMNDEPFAGLTSILSNDSWLDTNFSAKYLTDWFAAGLAAAKLLICP